MRVVVDRGLQKKFELPGKPQNWLSTGKTAVAIHVLTKFKSQAKSQIQEELFPQNLSAQEHERSSRESIAIRQSSIISCGRAVFFVLSQVIRRNPWACESFQFFLGTSRFLRSWRCQLKSICLILPVSGCNERRKQNAWSINSSFTMELKVNTDTEKQCSPRTSKNTPIMMSFFSRTMSST